MEGQAPSQHVAPADKRSDLLRMTVDIHCQVLKLHESPASLKQNITGGAQDFCTVLYFIFCLKKSIINQNCTANRRSSDKPDIYF